MAVQTHQARAGGVSTGGSCWEALRVQQVGKKATPSLHSSKRRTARATMTAHLPAHSTSWQQRLQDGNALVTSGHRSRTSSLPGGTSLGTGHSTSRPGRLDSSRHGAEGQAGGLNLNSHPPTSSPQVPAAAFAHTRRLHSGAARRCSGAATPTTQRWLRWKEPE